MAIPMHFTAISSLKTGIRFTSNDLMEPIYYDNHAMKRNGTQKIEH